MNFTAIQKGAHDAKTLKFTSSLLNDEWTK